MEDYGPENKESWFGAIVMIIALMDTCYYIRFSEERLLTGELVMMIGSGFPSQSGRGCFRPREQHA